MILKSLFIGLVLSICFSATARAVQTVRVDASSGAPRLVVDGKPVRSRIFFGIPGSRPLKIEPAGGRITFEFTPPEDEPAGATMHLRFGSVPGDVYLDEIHVEDLDGPSDVIPACTFEEDAADFTRDWTSWPPDDRNTVGTIRVTPGTGRDGSGGLHVNLKAPPGEQWPDFHIYHHPNLALRKGRRYRVSLWARAEPARTLTLAFYRPGEPFTFLGGPPSCFENQIKLAAAVGVDIVSFPLHMPWPRPGEPADWSTVDQQCQTVLDANGDALLLPRMWMGAPRWWREAHPDDVMTWEKGNQEPADVVVASPDYRRDAAARLTALVEHLEEKFGPSMAGYHPCGQNTGEWFYRETWRQSLGGYSAGTRDAWRRWLRTRYGNDMALRAAWDDRDATLGEAEVPSPEARRATPSGLLWDPVSQRPLIDFAQFQQEMMADCVCHLAKAARQASGGRKLIVFFYGYVFEFGAIHLGPAVSGHYALRRVLECPDIDVLCSPISYFDRGLGQSGPAMTAAESVALAGKMWLYEDDTRTYLGTGKFPGWQDRVDNIEETNSLLLRNTAQCAVRNFGTWWMDLGATGWFDDPRMWAKMAELEALDIPLLENPRPFRPEVAAVIDQRSMIRVAAGGHVLTRPGVYESRRPLGRMGAPYGQYLLDDVAAGRVQAKMYVFLTAWCLSPEERGNLSRSTQGALRIWCYAPGYHEEGGTSLGAMQMLTGFKLHKVSPPKAWAEPTDVGRRFGLRQGFGVEGPIEPLFAAVDAKEEEILAVYPDGTPAVALRQTSHGDSLFVGPPGLTSELLRAAARRAGVHLFTQSDCNVYANGPYLVLHGSEDGRLEIDTGGSGPIRDLISDEELARGAKVGLTLQRGETRILTFRPPPSAGLPSDRPGAASRGLYRPVR